MCFFSFVFCALASLFVHGKQKTWTQLCNIAIDRCFFFFSFVFVQGLRLFSHTVCYFTFFLFYAQRAFVGFGRHRRLFGHRGELTTIYVCTSILNHPNWRMATPFNLANGRKNCERSLALKSKWCSCARLYLRNPDTHVQWVMAFFDSIESTWTNV